MTAKKKMTAKQKAAKQTPFEESGWVVVGQTRKIFRAYDTKADARFWAFPGDRIIRVRITEIVK